MIFLVKREIRMKRIMAGVAIMFVSFGVIGGAPCQADVRDRPVIWAYWGHEPSEFLQRKGGMPGMFSLGEWMPKWYDRMHGEELIVKAAAAGVNTVYCHYFKGLGLKHEHDNMERTRGFVEIAHKHGVRVLGYCTFSTVFYETMKDEVPDLETWPCITQEGKPMIYYRQYYRWRPCREGREYMEYFKKVVSYGLRHVGLDGFHFDNSMVNLCFCERCQAAFRTWLAEHVKDPRSACGLEHFRNVRIPPDMAPEEGDEIHDPMVIWRDRCRHERHDVAVRELFGHVRSEGGRLIAYNSPVMHPHFCLSGSYLPGAWQANMIFSENGRFIRHEGGRNITQILAFKASRRMGFTLLDSNWPRVNGQHAIPSGADAIHRFLAQGMIYGNVCGSHWMARSVKRGDRVVMDDPAEYSMVSNAFTFFRDNAYLYSGGPVARTHLLFAKDTLYGWNARPRKNGIESFMSLGDRLNDAAVPYLLALEEDVDSIRPGDLLVLPDMRYVNANLHAHIVAAAARGVRILMTGKYGLYDENGRERDLDSPVIGLSEVKNVLHDIPADARIKIRGADGKSVKGVMVETSANADGDFVFHMLRPENSQTLGMVEADIDEPQFTMDANPSLHSFEPQCSLVSAERKEGCVTLRVRGLRTMASVIFRKKGKSR